MLAEPDEYAYKATPLSSEVPGLRRLERAATVALSSRDAEAMGIEPGAPVNVISRRGRVSAKAVLGEGVPQGTARMVARGGEASPTLVIEVLLDPAVLPVEPLEVEIVGLRSHKLEMSGFYDRQEFNERLGLGHYMTRLDIEERGAGQVSHILADIPRVQMMHGRCFTSRCDFPIITGSNPACREPRQHGVEGVDRHALFQHDGENNGGEIVEIGRGVVSGEGGPAKLHAHVAADLGRVDADCPMAGLDVAGVPNVGEQYRVEAGADGRLGPEAEAGSWKPESLKPDSRNPERRKPEAGSQKLEARARSQSLEARV